MRHVLEGLAAELSVEDSYSLAEHLFLLLEGAYVTGALADDGELLGRARALAETAIAERTERQRDR